MAIYSETVRVRLTLGQFELLRLESEKEEKTVSELVREAVQDKYTPTFAS